MKKQNCMVPLIVVFNEKSRNEIIRKDESLVFHNLKVVNNVMNNDLIF